MRVAAQIVEHVLGAPEGRFGIDHPVVSEQESEPSSESLGLRKGRLVAREVELAVLEGPLEAGDELAAKDSGENFEGKEETVSRVNPAGVIETESAGRNDAMHMRMQAELLIPGVQYAEEANFRTQVSGIASHLEKGFCTGAKQQVIEKPFVVLGQGHQLCRKCENHMDVRGWEKLLATRLDPAIPRRDLTLRAVAVAAAVVGDGGAMSAASALIEVTAQGSGTTPGNRSQHLDVLPTEPVTVCFDEGRSRGADEIGHLEGWPAHLGLLQRCAFQG